MVNLIFREGNRHVVLSNLPADQSVKITNLAETRIHKFNCPVHKSHSRATLLIDIADGSGEWNIVDYCCEEFYHEISSGMPFPWDRPPGIRRLNRAA
ncbi:MAG TPA: hypothetical protein VIS48_13510 [Candidatus Kryptonia bacterium]